MVGLFYYVCFMENFEEFEYKGYMSKEAELFFGCKLLVEERDGCAVVGHFVEMADGRIHMPSKNDVFTKNDDGSITVSSANRS